MPNTTESEIRVIDMLDVVRDRKQMLTRKSALDVTVCTSGDDINFSVRDISFDC
jgi:hypothetical protein